MERFNNTVTTISADQASGLRRMVSHQGGRATAFVGGTGTGVTSLVINLAFALASQNRRILLIDEDESPMSAVARLQLRQRHHFEHVVMRDVRLENLLLQAPQFNLLPLHIATTLAERLPPGRDQQLADEYDSVTAVTDHVLIDARPVSAKSPPGLAIASDEVVVTISPAGESITDAYAAIKRLHTEFGRRDFRVLVNRVRTLETALALFKRVKDVARTYLDVRLQLMGFVPEDEMLSRANKLAQPVAMAFPNAESSIAFEQLAAAMLQWPQKQNQPDRANLLFRALDLSQRFATGLA